MMTSARDFVVVQLDEARLLAARAVMHDAGVEIREVVDVAVPAGVSAADVARFGAWVGEQLQAADLPRGRVVVVVSRADVVLKVLTVPDAEGGMSETELGAIVRLQMLRQLAVAPEGTSIDFAPLGPAGAGGRRVLAAALPADRAAWIRAVAKAGGLTIRRIALRSSGAAVLLAEVSQRLDGPVLGVVQAGSGAELVVIEGAELAAARWVELPRETPEERDLLPERLAVEVKRTWIASRGPDSPAEPARVIVIGPGHAAKSVAQRCGQVLGVAGDSVGTPSLVTISQEGLTEEQHAALLPLGGVIAEVVLGRRLLDFSRPRKQPDTGAKTRQLALAGALGALLVCGGGWIVADRSLGGLRREISALQATQKELVNELAQRRLTEARLNDLEGWSGARVDWTAHLSEIAAALPDARIAPLDVVSGRSTGDVTFAPKGAYPGGSWGKRLDASLDVAGKTIDRQAASGLREALLNRGVYTVTSQGADTPDRFALRLRTSVGTPPSPAPTEQAKPKPDEGPKPGEGPNAAGPDADAAQRSAKVGP